MDSAGTGFGDWGAVIMYRFLSELVQPLVLLNLLVLLGLVNLWRKRRESCRRLLLPTAAFLLLSLGCTPIFSYLLLASLESRYPPLQTRPDNIQAIVVLGGWVKILDEAGLQVELGEDTLSRCLKAAEVYHQGTPCPVVVSGGKVDPEVPGPSLATSMRNLLVRLGVPSEEVILEDRSRTTYENAVQTCQLLRERNLNRILLVTDAGHLTRAVGCFRQQGVEGVPCSCNYRAVWEGWRAIDFLPNPRAARGVGYACHEWLGIFWYWVQGRW